MPIPCQAISHLIEGVETTGGKMVFLNNQQERPAGIIPDEIVRSLWKHKANINEVHVHWIIIL
jgi:hypothetical protein